MVVGGLEVEELEKHRLALERVVVRDREAEHLLAGRAHGPVADQQEGRAIQQDFLAGKDNACGNPFDNEMALGYTDQGNICRFGVFWQIAAHGEGGQWLGEKMSCSMSNSLGQPQARRQLHGRWESWEVPNYWATDRLPKPMRHHSGHGGSASFLSAEFIAAVAARREPTVDLYESIAMNAPGIVAHESAQKDGELLEVPNFDK